MTKYLLGVDGGASKTRSLVANSDGTIIASGFGGCANRNVTSWEAAVLQVRLGVIDALARGEILPHDIIYAHYGLGGVATSRCEQEWQDALGDLTPQATITIENDVFLAVRAVDQAHGIGVVSGSGGNIGLLSPTGKFHLNGHVRFNSAQLGRRTLQKIMFQIQGNQSLDPFSRALLELAHLDEEKLKQAMHTNPQELAREVSPLIIELYKQGYEQAQTIVHTWLEQVGEDVEDFRLTNHLESLPICFGGTTFSDMQSILTTNLKIEGQILVADTPLAEGAVKGALLAHKY